MRDADDPGAVAERTLLAWRRTSLLLGAASVLGARLLADDVGAWVFGVGLLGVGLALISHGNASMRYRQAKIPIASGSPLVPAPSHRLATMVAAVGVVGVLAVAVIVMLNPLAGL